MPEKPPQDPPDPTPAPLPWSRPGLLVGVDRSELSLRALRTAAALGRSLKLPVHAVAVWEFPVMLYGDHYSPEIETRPSERAREVIDAASREVFGSNPPEWFTSSTEQGRPSAVLVGMSAEAYMLLVGSRGHGGFAALMLGSVSAACASHAKCPVLIVR